MIYKLNYKYTSSNPYDELYASGAAGYLFEADSDEEAQNLAVAEQTILNSEDTRIVVSVELARIPHAREILDNLMSERND